ncbi:MAG: hypothetical protein EXS05_23295 [Planctomycetaceae bacterium]|nr:hypothetical protein [Planctomycetaceae bacterium]
MKSVVSPLVAADGRAVCSCSTFWVAAEGHAKPFDQFVVEIVFGHKRNVRHRMRFGVVEFFTS